MVKSPCIDVCKLNEDEVCIGCYRTRKEIYLWTSLSDYGKLDILSQLEKRKLKFKQEEEE